MTKSEKVPILGIFSPKTILMFREGLKNRVGRPTGTTHTFHLSLMMLKPRFLVPPGYFYAPKIQESLFKVRYILSR